MRTPTVSSMATGTPGTVVWAGCAQRSHADPDRCAVLLNPEIFVLKSSASQAASIRGLTTPRLFLTILSHVSQVSYASLSVGFLLGRIFKRDRNRWDA